MSDALQLLSRFSLPPNSLGYCGRDSAPERFKRCFINGECDGVEDELTKFIVLHPYIKTLAEITGKSKFSYEVAEAYWIGNELLEEAKVEHYDLLLDHFLEQGVPEWFVEELKQKRPKKFIPHHLFQVLFIGVGKASGSVPFNLDSINNCMVRWGEIKDIHEETLDIELNSLSDEHILEKKEETFSYSPDFFPELGVGGFVAVHWKQPIKLLSADEIEKIEYWTREIVRSVSEDRPKT